MTEIKHENTFLTIKNYKEPLKKIPRKEGFGYYGTILVSKDGTLIQCHMCGKLFASLPGHIQRAHKTKVTDYKKTFDLAKSTALVSEMERYRMKQAMLNYIKTLTPQQQKERREKMRDIFRKRGKFQPTISLETKNKRGTCPDQLLAKITEVAKKLKHTPSLGEFIDETGTQRFKFLIIKTFGSWKNALKMLKMSPKGSHSKGGRVKHTDQQLLEYLKIYTQENRKLPTATDCKRGLLPTYETYERHFETFENARQLAGVYQILN